MKGVMMSKIDGAKVPVIRGWGIYNEEELKDYIENNKLGMIYDGVSAKCDLNCVYCVTKSGRAVPGELNLDERKSVLKQANELGCKIVHIAARGEPTIDPLFKEQLEYINELNMTPVIFTHGGNLTQEWVDTLWDNNASIMLKIHSLKPEVQDFFAATKGYTERRNKGLDLLLKKGFNKNFEGQTRLGADILVMKKNYDEIEDIYRWCRENNIFPLVKPLMCNNRGASKFVLDNLYISPLEVKKLYERLSEIDKKEYGFDWKPMPPYAGVNCNYYYYHLCVTIMGDVWPCIGIPELQIGNIREKSLKECWDSEQVRKIKNIKKEVTGVCQECENSEVCYGCPCRRTYNNGFENTFTCNSCWEDNL